MNPILRRYSKLALILAGVILALLAFAWLALPRILQSQAETFIAEKTGHRLTMARPEINPLAWSLRLRELQLVDPQGGALVSFGELFIDLSAATLVERALVFDAIRLDGLAASLIQRKEGGLNWSALIEALKSPQEPSTGLPRLDIRQLRVGGAQLTFADERVTPAFVTSIEPLELELTDVSTLPDDSGRFRLQARTQLGAEVAWQGDVTLNPLASVGRLDVAGLDLARLAPLMQGRLPLAAPAGIATFGTDYRLKHAGGTLNLGLERMRLAISALRLQQTPGDAVPQVAVDSVTIGDGSFDLTTGQLALAAIQLQGSRVEAALDKNARRPVLTLEQISLSDARVDLAQRSASLAALAIKGGSLSARRDAQGSIDLQSLADGFAAPPRAAAPAKPETAAAWRFKLGRASLDGFAIRMRDESVAPAVELDLDNIAIAVDGVSENLKTPLPLKASLEVRSGGRLELAGTLTPADAAADLKIKLSDLTLKAAQPYVSRFAALDVAGGHVSAAGRVSRDAKGSGYRGSFGVHELRLNEAGTKNVFLAWKALSSDDVELGAHRLDIARLRLDGLDTKLIIDKDKSTNLQRVLRKQEAAVSPPPPTVPAAAPSERAAAAAESAPAKTAAPGFVVNIDRLSFRRGALDFADRSLVFPFGTRIHGLRGSIAGLSSKPGALAQVELDGEVDEFGLARVVGQFDVFKPTDFMDLKVVFRNIEMTRMTPYSATFAGRKINSGKLALDLEYKIKKRQMEGDNKVVIDRLELGERVESPTAKDLPLDLAIALLSDSDGRIDLGLPISGSLDDPQFSYGQLVWKAIANVLTKIVTAPFRALGALFGGGEKLDSIAFEAGAARLTPPEREKLVRLAAMLNKRPGLALSVHGTWTEADRLALQDLRVRQAVAEKSGQAAGDKGDPGPLSTRTPRVQAALESLFADRIGSAELSALKDGFRSANPGQLEESVAGRMMSRLSGLLREKRSLSESEVARLKGADFHAVLFERLRAQEPVEDGVLQALAVRRGEHALTNLKAAGAPEARIRTGAAGKGEAAGREALLKLELGKAEAP